MTLRQETNILTPSFPPKPRLPDSTPTRDVFAGNILLWSLTNVDNETNYELHIELEDWSGNKRFARYRGFRVGSERDAYRLYHANVYFGNAGEF